MRDLGVPYGRVRFMLLYIINENYCQLREINSELLQNFLIAAWSFPFLAKL
jgi:hypothetical protein